MMSADKKFYTVHAREKGKKASQTRRAGFIPGVIYGGRLEGGQPIQIEKSVLVDMFRHNTKSSVINVDFDGNKGSIVVQEIQNNPLTGEILHVDFHAIRKDEVLTMGVPVIYHGEDEVTSRRLVVSINLTELLVKGPADKIPEELTVDLRGKTPEDRIEARSIPLPEGMELVTDPDELLITIGESKVEQDLEQVAAEAQDGESAEPELVGHKKDAGEE